MNRNREAGPQKTGQGVLAFEKAEARHQKQNTTKTQQFIADGLDNTGVFEHRLLPSYCVEGSPRWKAIHQCVRCHRRTDNIRPIDWGNSEGPIACFMLCIPCYKRRQRMAAGDRELFDLSVKVRLLRQMARTAGGVK